MNSLLFALRRISSDDAGAVTIDWVVVTSGIVFLGILAAYSIFNDGVSHTVTDVNALLVVAADIDAGVAPSIN